MIIFGFAFYGLGIGMGYYPILKTSWKYFPEKKGFLTGFILCVFGLCPTVFTAIADFVLNPNGVKMDEKTGIYPKEVAIKMKNFALIMSITMGICGILSQILMFPLDNVISTDKDEKINNEENNNNENNNTDIEKNNIDNENNEENNIFSEEEITKKNEEILKNQPFMQAFKSWRFHLFNIMSVGTLCK